MAQYPSAPASFTTKQNGDPIEAAHVNDLQEEVIVITDGLLNGLAHHLIPSIHNTYDLGSSSRRWRDGWFGRNLVVGGVVTAPSFVGDGSGLTGVPGVTTLDGLTDVVTPAPSNGQLLTFNTATAKWEAKTLTLPGGGAVNLDDLLDVVIAAPVDGQLLTFRTGQWKNETPSLIPAGILVPFASDTIPGGWLLCDGAAVSRATFATLFAAIGTAYGPGDGSTTFNVPDMRVRFPVGKAAGGGAWILGAFFGAWDHTHGTPQHSHNAGTLTVASHNHSSGTLATASHTHPAGSLVVFAHSHPAGTLTANHGHGHSLSVDTGGMHQHHISGFTGPGGFHAHNVTINNTGGADTGSGIQLMRPGTYPTDAGGEHAHGFELDTNNAGDHGHGLSGGVNGENVNVAGATADAAPGIWGNTGAAAPGLTGNTGATSPAITGATELGGAGLLTSAANPPSLVVNYIIKV